MRLQESAESAGVKARCMSAKEGVVTLRDLCIQWTAVYKRSEVTDKCAHEVREHGSTDEACESRGTEACSLHGLRSNIVAEMRNQ